MRKNVASQNVAGQIANATTGAPITTGVSVFVTGDGGTQTAGGGTLTHKGNGHWNYVPTQAETNFNHIAFTFTHASGVNQTVNVYTVSFNPHDTVRLGLTALPNAAAEAAGGLFTRGTGAGQINQQANGQVDVNLERVRNAVVNALIAGRVDANAQVVGDKTGYSLTQTFPANFADLAITATTGRVTAGTVIDKTGYSLANGSIASATFAPNAIDATAIAANAITSAKVATDAIGGAQFAQAAADKVWGTTTRALTDKAGFSLANGSIVTATFAAGAINATVAPNLDAAVSTRLAAAAYTAPDNAGIAANGTAIAGVQADTDDIQTRLPAALVGGRIDANMGAISADDVAADNLEAMFDGSGYANQFAPSTQQQVDALAAGVAAINVAASGFTLTTGTEVNTFTATVSLGGLAHELSDAAGTFDGFYEFDIGPLGVPVNLTAILRVFSSNDVWFVQGFNWSLSQWENIRQIDGKNQTTFDTFSITLFQRFAGTGANLGKVRIRMFTNTGTTSTMFVDQLAMAYIQQVNTITRAGLAQGGGATFIDLDAGASAIDDFYRPSLVRITAGAGAIQVRRADSYNGTSKRLTVATPWVVNPDATSQFEILPWASVRVTDLDVILAELTGIPGASPNIVDALALQYMALRNRRETTATTDRIHNDANSPIGTAALSDDGTTFVKGKVG